ncbi:MAG: SIS domain-containing protein [Patescibacteria group bacterium]
MIIGVMLISEQKKYRQQLDCTPRIDTNRFLESIEAFPAQARQAWSEARHVHIPSNYRTVKTILALGMGGSGWPARIIRTLFANDLKIPMTVLGDYRLPGWVDRNTLVIVSSYSGTTEEPLTAAKSARTRGSKMMAITLGGSLVALVKKWRIPAYVFTETYNPSRQPRMGAGYMIFGTAGLLAAAGQLRLTDRQIISALSRTIQKTRTWRSASPLSKNLSKQWAVQMKGRIPIIMASEHLEATAEAFRNRINENAKQFSAYYPIPDLNHHLLEGLANPTAARRLLGVFLTSDLYDRRNQKRHEITRKVFEHNHVPTVMFRAGGNDRVEDALNSLAFSGYATYWLSILNQVDASVIPWVDYFKDRLARR